MVVTVESGGVRRRKKDLIPKICTVKTMRKRLPILTWVPKYNFTFLIQDIIAGITVGLTAIPQGIAYAVVAGLSPEYGLYSGIMGGFVYLFFGSCKDVTVGPTAIMSALTAKYVSGYSPDFAVLAAFLSGVVVLAMGLLHLGFLVEFISQPVISGFTTAAAFQIASSQLKSFFGLEGPSGNYFAESMTNFVHNISTIKLWDSVLGLTTIVILVFLKILGRGCGRNDPFLKQIRWFVSLARNAVVVILGIIVAYVLKITTHDEPLKLIGEIESGLPTFKVPPFSTTHVNETYTFTEMASVFGLQAFVLPLVAILETVAIAKAFANGGPVDATQEMIAVGICNIIGSFASSMPVTGSFTRTALNNASGVATAAGGIFTSTLIILALSLLTSTFYFIPKATLAGLIITAMYSMTDYEILGRLWKDSKKEFFNLILTIAVSLYVGLEYGIVTGIIIDIIFLLFRTARPKIQVTLVNSTKGVIVIIPLFESVPYCVAEHVRRRILRESRKANVESLIIVDGTNLKNMDTTVASNLMSVIEDVERYSVKIQFLNFKPRLVEMCVRLYPNYLYKFVVASDPIELVTQFPKALHD